MPLKTPNYGKLSGAMGQRQWAVRATELLGFSFQLVLEPFVVGSCVVEPASSFKYLGVRVDSLLNFDRHWAKTAGRMKLTMGQRKATTTVLAAYSSPLSASAHPILSACFSKI
jgi:hypothetical protein